MKKYILLILSILLFLQAESFAGKAINCNPTNYKQQFASMTAGDTLLFSAGDYTSGLFINNLNGSESAWYVLKSDAPHSAIFIGRDGANTIDITNASYVKIEGFKFDGKNIADIDAIKAGGGGSNLYSHHIIIYDNIIVGHGNNQQVCGISTKITSWDWTISHNIIDGAGTGIYLGNSDGSAPFIRGLIEYNLVVNPTGYCMQIKHQNDRPAIVEIPTDPSSTIVRHNVFSKDNRPSPDGDRPCLLLGGQPLTGTGVDDRVEIYGNFFFNNPREYLLQGTGNLTIHNNILVSELNGSINIQTHNSHPPKEVFIYQNSILSGATGVSFDGTKTATLTARGNAVFAKTSFNTNIPDANVYGDLLIAVGFFNTPQFDINKINMFPLSAVGNLNVNLNTFSKDMDWNKDFNGNIQTGSIAGAYNGRGKNPGWTLGLAIKSTPALQQNTTWQVGPTRQYKVPSAVFGLISDGDTVEIDAGTYSGDVCAFKKNNIVIRGVGGYAHLEANGKSSGGKAIWVIQGNNNKIENIEFSGCTVPDKNGAGIRLEGTGITILHCYFHDNEDGILCGANDSSVVIIEYSEFARNGAGDGYSHNLYIGHVGMLNFQFNYSHHAKIGHNLKSRANVNWILNNRIMDEETGNSSFLIDLPNGGESYVIGNLLMQGPNAENKKMINYGAEGLTNQDNSIFIVNNTFVNKRSSATYVYVQQGTRYGILRNNIFAGNGLILDGSADTISNIFFDTPAQAGFTDEPNYDYHLTKGSKAIDAGTNPGVTSNGVDLSPLFEYKHPTDGVKRNIIGKIDIGAYEFPDSISNSIIPEYSSNTVVYPNPASNIFTILQKNSENPEFTLKLFNLMGEEILLCHISSETTFSTENIPDGVYLLKIQNGTETEFRKIIIRK